MAKTPSASWSRLPRELRAEILQRAVSSSKEEDDLARWRRKRWCRDDGLSAGKDLWWPDTRTQVENTRALFCIDRETRAIMQGLYPDVAGEVGRRISESYITRPPQEFEYLRALLPGAARSTLSATERSLVARTTALNAEKRQQSWLFEGKLWRSIHEKSRLEEVLQLCGQNLAYFSGFSYDAAEADAAGIGAPPPPFSLPRLRVLDLKRANLHDEALATWLRSTGSSLRAIELGSNQNLRFGSSLTETFISLATSLRILSLSDCKIDDETINRFPLHLFTHLEVLNLRGNQLTGRLPIGRSGQPLWQIRAVLLDENSSMQSLGRSLENFSGSKNLRSIWLTATGVRFADDTELKALRSTNMSNLKLDKNSSIDDLVAARLPGLFAGVLRELNVESTGISAAGLRALRRGLPDTDVDGDYFN